MNKSRKQNNLQLALLLSYYRFRNEFSSATLLLMHVISLAAATLPYILIIYLTTPKSYLHQPTHTILGLSIWFFVINYANTASGCFWRSRSILNSFQISIPTVLIDGVFFGFFKSLPFLIVIMLITLFGDGGLIEKICFVLYAPFLLALCGLPIILTLSYISILSKPIYGILQKFLFILFVTSGALHDPSFLPTELQILFFYNPFYWLIKHSQSVLTESWSIPIELLLYLFFCVLTLVFLYLNLSRLDGHIKRWLHGSN